MRGEEPPHLFPVVGTSAVASCVTRQWLPEGSRPESPSRTGQLGFSFRRCSNLASMSVDALLKLREDIAKVLTRKAVQLKDQLWLAVERANFVGWNFQERHIP
jgi:hypothetical protein